MKQKTYWFVILIVLVLSACAPAPTVTPTLPPAAPVLTPTIPANLPPSEADVPRVTVDEAKAAFERGEAVIVDVRSAEAFAASHVAGAISIPVSLIDADPANVQLDKATWIITYCT